MDVIQPPPVWPSGERSLAVQERIKRYLEVPPLNEEPSEKLLAIVEETVTEETSLPSCQVSSGTMEFDKGEGPLACEPKAVEMSQSDLFNEWIVPLVKYLDKKMIHTPLLNYPMLVWMYLRIECDLD
ncbi:hypothetical protein AXG93_3012s1040 [Marchantia polymorpha subsp. ruderalis]|uniref:Uncharacterized protein n=1 Tax=Marchantia polymorpha subsp. ruderalis TaxID=1480154 RepID=A0A176VBL6_MARPO|nr:hypothetical protein AXG93_3012s1040 [Marchantia polymorpha subsp. ruderalis]